MTTPKRKRPYNRPRKKGVRSTPRGGHVPVLPAECLQALALEPGQTAVDATLGHAGHARLMLEAVGPEGLLIGLDLDGQNLSAASAKLGELGENVRLRHSNFAAVAQVLGELGVERVHGILADLGMSSMQVDDRTRGFSFMRDGPLDMRMDPTRGATAADLLATLPAEELTRAFAELGDEPEAGRIADAIVKRRATVPILTTLDLRQLIEAAAPVEVLRGPGRMPARKQRLLPATRVFQALRILVNRELANLQALLRTAPYLLADGGTLAVISFHSGEDRLVKQHLQAGLTQGVYAAISERAIRPTAAEKESNPRSRSAKLRWGRTPALTDPENSL